MMVDIDGDTQVTGEDTEAQESQPLEVETTDTATATLEPGEPSQEETQAPPVDLTPKPRTYTEEEYRSVQAARDREVAARESQLQQQAMQAWIAQRQQQEAQAQAQDKAYVDQGMLTEQDAEQRRTLRQELAQMQQQRQGMMQEAEQVAYVVHADRIAKKIIQEEGLDQRGYLALFNELTSGDRVKSVGDLEAKAERIVRKAYAEVRKAQAKKPETFDKGPGGATVGANVANMSPMEKIQWGLKHSK